MLLGDLWVYRLNRSETIGLLESHSQNESDIDLFFKENGYKDSYIGSEILIWLGY